MKNNAQPNVAAVAPVKAQVISNPFEANNTPPETQQSSQPSQAPSEPPMAQPPSAQGQSVTLPDAAADNDLIEKEWVDAIEQAVHAYADDPYLLQQHQAAISRDYLKKRFNLDIEAAS